VVSVSPSDNGVAHSAEDRLDVHRLAALTVLAVSALVAVPVGRVLRRQAYGWRLATAVALVAFSVWWVLADPVPGGGIVVSVSGSHGADVKDAIVIPLLALAGFLVWRSGRH
jgi:hypothetical protein